MVTQSSEVDHCEAGTFASRNTHFSETLENNYENECVIDLLSDVCGGYCVDRIDSFWLAVT